jgi:hypothetical protein
MKEIAVLVAGLLLAAALAQPEVELKRLDKAASCLIGKDRVGAANWAATGPGTAEEASAGDRLAPLAEKCAPGIPLGELADAIALRLFNRYNTRRIALPSSAEEDNRFANGVLDGAKDRPKEVRVLRCVALMHPEAAEDFVRARFKSRREAEMRGELVAAIASCTPLGEQISWTGLSLRLGLAREVYRASPAALLARGTMGPRSEDAARVR